MDNKKIFDLKKIKLVDINKVIPYENNPRVNDQSVQFVANSIEKFGFKVPVVVDKDMVIINGHTRLKAAKRLGLKEIPVIIADDLSPEEAKAFRIADNSAGESSYWDIDLLNLELAEIPFDMSEFGINLDEEEEEFKGDTEPKEKDIKKMELKAFEHYDYVVFVFNNQQDFLNVCTNFGIEKVDGGWVNRKIGIGRVLKGEELVKKIRDKDSDIIEGQK